MSSKQWLTLLGTAKKVVMNSTEIYTKWLNRQTKLSLDQNIIIFERESLMIYAAPWKYPLSAKLDHISGRSRSHDITDAAHYLLPNHFGSATTLSIAVGFWSGLVPIATLGLMVRMQI